MLLTKVQQKTVALSHEHARLEATHRVLSELLETTIQLEEETEEKSVHRSVGVLWSTFAVQMVLALAVGAVVESSRIRSQQPKTGVDGGVADAIAASSSTRPKSAVFGSF